MFTKVDNSQKILKNPLRILNCSLTLTAQLEHLFNHKVAVCYLSKTLLPLQHCHLTYISKQTSRNGGDDILKLSDHVRATYLLIYSRGQGKQCILPGISLTCYRRLARTVLPSVLNEYQNSGRRRRGVLSGKKADGICFYDRCQTTPQNNSTDTGGPDCSTCVTVTL